MTDKRIPYFIDMRYSEPVNGFFQTVSVFPSGEVLRANVSVAPPNGALSGILDDGLDTEACEGWAVKHAEALSNFLGWGTKRTLDPLEAAVKRVLTENHPHDIANIFGMDELRAAFKARGYDEEP